MTDVQFGNFSRKKWPQTAVCKLQAAKTSKACFSIFPEEVRVLRTKFGSTEDISRSRSHVGQVKASGKTMQYGAFNPLHTYVCCVMITILADFM
jgi:hypothetical protein